MEKNVWSHFHSGGLLYFFLVFYFNVQGAEENTRRVDGFLLAASFDMKERLVLLFVRSFDYMMPYIYHPILTPDPDLPQNATISSVSL